jgi:cellobiose-specific phosphotransferase system component IIA
MGDLQKLNTNHKGVSMKRLATVVLLSSIATLSFAQKNPGAADPCLAKRQDILTQIDQAKAAGNDKQLAGLNKALKANDANCTPEALRRAREKDVSEARAKVAERDRELNEAKAEGKDKEKIAKREQKLNEAQAELQRAQKALGN